MVIPNYLKGEGRQLEYKRTLPESAPNYLIRSVGPDKSTYLRIGSTTRLADPAQIEELYHKSEHISWDQLKCVRCPVEKHAINKLCRDINEYREANGKDPKKKVNQRQLINMGILIEERNPLRATNAYALLTGNKGAPDLAIIQCPF